MVANIILAAVFLFLGISGLFIVKDCLTCKKRFTDKVEGTVTYTFMTHHIIGSRLMAKFEYTYKGKEYQSMTEDEFPKGWHKKHKAKVGMKFDLYINPNKPKQIRLSNENETVLGIALLVFCIGLIVAAFAELGALL